MTDRLTALLLAAQQGDEAALRQFVAETEHDVRTLCRYLGDRDSADDLAQETYARALSSLHRFRATGPAKSWLLTIARRTCADAVRKRTRRRRVDQRVVGLARDHLVEAPTEASQTSVDELLRHLGDDQRAAFVLTQLNGLRYEEAAKLLEVPVGTIRSRVARARSELLSVMAVEPERRLERPGS